MMELEVGFPKRFARVTGKTWRDLRRVLEAGRPAEEQPGPQHEPDGDPLGSSDEPPPRSTARWPGLSGELEA
jgi:hypothetical protein